MNPTLDLSPWLSRPPRQLSNEDLSSLSSLLAKNIRRSGIPRLQGLKPVKEFKVWEEELAKELANKNSFQNDLSIAMEFTCRKTIRDRYGCGVVYAVYNGAGSFRPLLDRYHYRTDLAWTILAQASLLSLYDKKAWLIEASEEGGSAINSLYKLAKDVLNIDGYIFTLPLHAIVGDQEYFHGMIITIFENGKVPDEEAKATLGFFVHHLGVIMGDSRRYPFPAIAFPAVNGGCLQYIEKELISAPLGTPREMLRVKHPASTSLGLWCGEDHQHSAHRPFDKMILENISFCQRSMKLKERDELIPLISRALKAVFNAEDCFFVRCGEGTEFEVIGKTPAASSEKYENTVAISAMIGAPYQMADGHRVIIAIPHYAGGRSFVGASVIIVSRDEPLLTSRIWQQVLCFCHHTFNALYTPLTEVPRDLYSNDYPWHTYIEMNHGDNITFPPFLPRTEEGIWKFGKKELSQISDWLVKSMRRSDIPWNTGMTCIEELKRCEEEGTAMELHQTTTTTIMDLCRRACKDDWQTTMNSVFDEAAKFLKGEDISLMWLAVHQGNGRFEVYHSRKGELDEEDKMACEILAQRTTLQDSRSFIPSDDPDPYSKLMHNKIGDFSFISIPVYEEDEITVQPDDDPDEWHKNPGRLIGVFTAVVRPKRPEPSYKEWSTWGMFIPRLCLVMQKAKEAGKLSYCAQNADFGGNSSVIDKLWLR